MIVLFALALVAPIAPSRDPQHGASTRANFEAMIVPPARRDPSIIEGGNGAIGAAATRRYLTDKVKRPPRTGNVTLGSGVSE